MKTLIAFLLLLSSAASAQTAAEVHGATRYKHVTSTLNSTGLLGSDTSDVTLCTFTVPANTWLDGEEIVLHTTLLWTPGDSTSGLEYCRSQFTVNGSLAYTFDSSALGTTIGSAPFEFVFTRIGTQVYFTPAMVHLATKSAEMSLQGKGSNGLESMTYDKFSYVSAGHANGNKFSAVDFTHDIQIKWNAKWQTLPNDQRDVLKIISGGCQVIELD